MRGNSYYIVLPRVSLSPLPVIAHSESSQRLVRTSLPNRLLSGSTIYPFSFTPWAKNPRVRSSDSAQQPPSSISIDHETVFSETPSLNASLQFSSFKRARCGTLFQHLSVLLASKNRKVNSPVLLPLPQRSILHRKLPLDLYVINL